MEPDESQKLCLQCGICCTGELIRRAPFPEGEPVEDYRQAGIRIEPKDNGQPGYFVPLPCDQFREGRCQTYSCRPSICGSYRCSLLKKFDRGEVDFESAVKLTKSAKEVSAKLKRLLERDFPEHDEDSLQGALRSLNAWAKSLTENEHVEFRRKHPEFLLSLAAFENHLRTHFH